MPGLENRAVWSHDKPRYIIESDLAIAMLLRLLGGLLLLSSVGLVSCQAFIHVF